MGTRPLCNGSCWQLSCRTALTTSLSTGTAQCFYNCLSSTIFTDWLLGDFRDEILQLQLKADVCYKHIRDKRKETTLLDVAFSERGQPISIQEQESMLNEVYSRIMQTRGGSAEARQQTQQAAAKAAEEELAASAAHHAGDPGVVTMLVGSVLELKDLWEAWDKHVYGCQPLRIYKAESLDLYPADQNTRHQMRWLRPKTDGMRFDQFRQLLLTMDRLVRKKGSGNRSRDANTIISNWRRSIFSTPTCPISSVAGLAVALKDYAKGSTEISGASGGQKRKADRTVVKQLTRERLEFFF